jgi:hypothetical protein
MKSYSYVQVGILQLAVLIISYDHLYWLKLTYDVVAI